MTLSLAIAVAEETAGNQDWLIESGEEIALAIVVAIVVGGLGGRFTSEARRRGWASQASESLAVVALAIFAYAGATAVGGNGFVAAFGAGIAFRTAPTRLEPSVEFAESIGLAASYLVWLMFGVALVGPVILAGFDAALIGYALLSLTIIRGRGGHPRIRCTDDRRSSAPSHPFALSGADRSSAARVGPPRM